MHKLLKCIAVVLLILLAIGLALMFAAGFIYDGYASKAIGRVQQKIPGLYLKNEVTSSSLLGRKGVIEFNYAKAPSFLGGAVQGAVRYELSFSLSGVDVSWYLDKSAGNLESLISNALGLNLPAIRGDAGWSLFKLGAYGSVKAAAFEQALGEDGTCSIAQVELDLFSRNFKQLTAVLSLPKLSCAGSKLYFGHPSFALDGQNFKASFVADGLAGNLRLREGQIGFDRLKGDISSVYAIGFEPEDQVRDPSLRDGIDFDHFNFVFELGNLDLEGFADFNVNGQGNFNFAFPRVKQGQQLPFYDISNFDVTAGLHKINFKVLINDLLQNQDDLGKLLSCLSLKPKIELGNLSFSHQGEAVKLSGNASFSLKRDTLKPERIFADFSAQAGSSFVKDLTDMQYQDALQQLLERGAVTFDGRNYATRLRLDDGKITLNGKAFSADD